MPAWTIEAVTQLVTAAPRAPLALHRPAWVAVVGRTIGAGLDGLLVGMVAGYVVLTALGAPSHHLGLPSLAIIPIVGLGVAGIAASGALIAIGIARGVGWIGGRIVALGAGRAPAVATVAALAAWPFRTIAGLPAGWIGALLILIALANAGRELAPVGFLVPPGMLVPFIYIGAIATALGAMARALRPHHRTVGAMVGAAAAVVVVAALTYAIWPGPTDHLVAADPAYAGPAVTGAVDDPGAPGPYGVETLSYGSGHDTRRPAFGAEADLITPTIDATAVLRPLGAGADEARALWWGFGTDALPLDGLVWAPRGDGPFPLVLIVHGNHAMGDFSEDGYAYLGEHLASRGFLAVSVDEDFLNGSWADDWEGSEQLVRAWLLLLHLDQWRTWAADPTGPFHDRVDLDQVALIGHSRGGEASSVAAMLAPLPAAPRPGMAPWPTGLDIDAVVAIAPSDGQYPTSVLLDGVDFLTLQGGHDADARAWSGIRQYGRSVLRPDGFKAAVWSYRANHGRFNSIWAGDDQGPFSGTQLDTAALLPASAQEDLARTTIGAFLEASLHGRDAYQGVFARPSIARDWLPADDIVLVRSAVGTTRPLTGGGPDLAAKGLTLTAEGFTAAGAMSLPLRALQDDQGARAVNARWAEAGPDPTWSVTGIRSLGLGLAPGSTARFALADGRDPGAGDLDPLDIAVEVADHDGTIVALPLAAVGSLPPPLRVQLAKIDAIEATSTVDLSLRSPVERVLQTYAIPLSMFTELDAAFSASHLDTVRLRIGRTGAGAVWIADIGIVP